MYSHELLIAEAWGRVAEKGTLIGTPSPCPVLKMKRSHPEPRNVLASRSWEWS